MVVCTPVNGYKFCGTPHPTRIGCDGLGSLTLQLQGLQHRLIEGIETRLLDGIHSRTLRLGSRDEHDHPGIRGYGESIGGRPSTWCTATHRSPHDARIAFAAMRGCRDGPRSCVSDHDTIDGGIMQLGPRRNRCQAGGIGIEPMNIKWLDKSAAIAAPSNIRLKPNPYCAVELCVLYSGSSWAQYGPA